MDCVQKEIVAINNRLMGVIEMLSSRISKTKELLPTPNSAMDAICPHCRKDYPIGTYTELDTVFGTKIFRCGNCKRLYEGKQHQ